MVVHFLDAKAPDGMRLYAIGDVHGRLDLLEGMHAIIADEIARDQPNDWRIIHVGDYVDRGPDSRGVIEFLVRATADDRIIALCGNHDSGFLDFLGLPEKGGLFANFGGQDTARSYGVEIDFGSEEKSAAGGHRLAQAIPSAHLDFLRHLPRSIAFGDFFFCHAGIRPGVPLDRQDPEDLIWIRGDFLGHPGLHPKVIVHGHTPHHEAQVMANRVNVDTLAYESGRLTALVVDGDEKRLIEAAL